MSRKLFRRMSPSPQQLRGIRSLRPLGEWIYDPNLWHINRASTAKAFATGLFCAMIPVPGQIVIAAFMAVKGRANLPLSVSLVFVTNPLTMPVIYYGAYKLGAKLLGVGMQPVAFEISWAWLSGSLGAIWEPFLLGCFVIGVGSASVAWLFINALWRWRVGQEWRSRQEARRAKEIRAVAETTNGDSRE